jgi:hypothetical protein
LEAASDAAIWDWALREAAAILRKDEDFALRKTLNESLLYDRKFAGLSWHAARRHSSARGASGRDGGLRHLCYQGEIPLHLTHAASLG